MKKFMLGSIALIALANAATAADLGSGPVYKMPAYYDWTGFYVGGQVGGIQGNGSYTNLNNTSTFGGAAIGSAFSQNNSGVIGGGQIGYNGQIENVVVGIEASILGSSVTSSSSQFNDDNFSSKLNNMVLVTGRLGYANNNWLFYGKGGYAGAQQTTSVSDTNPAFGTGSGSTSNWHSGWTAGAGIEYGINKNWIVGLEYNYVNLSAKEYELDGTDVPAASYLWDIANKYNLVTGRLSYKFN